MNSWKELFDTFNSSMWIFPLFWLLNWFQVCFQSYTIVISRLRPPYCLYWLYRKVHEVIDLIKNTKVHWVMNKSKTNKWQARKWYINSIRIILDLDTAIILFKLSFSVPSLSWQQTHFFVSLVGSISNFYSYLVFIVSIIMRASASSLWYKMCT